MSGENRRKRSFKEYVRIYVTGLIMGGADVVPGVSGGTMAFILGIYEELIESIRKFTSAETIAMGLKGQGRKAMQTLPWPFLLALGLGIVTAIVLLSSPIHWMLKNQPVLIWAFFFGLVLASIFTVFGRVRKWNPATVTALILGCASGWVIVGLPFLNHPPESLLYLVLCGAIAICAMILPGISGSFILVLMGKYDLMLNAVRELKNLTNVGQNLLILGMFLVGIVVGISSFVRLLSYLFRKFHDLTVSVLIGFMAGSLRKVWPWKASTAQDASNVLPQEFNAEFWSAIGLAVLGFLLVLAIESIARQLEKQGAGAKKA